MRRLGLRKNRCSDWYRRRSGANRFPSLSLYRETPSLISKRESRLCIDYPNGSIDLALFIHCFPPLNPLEIQPPSNSQSTASRGRHYTSSYLNEMTIPSSSSRHILPKSSSYAPSTPRAYYLHKHHHKLTAQSTQTFAPHCPSLLPTYLLVVHNLLLPAAAAAAPEGPVAFSSRVEMMKLPTHPSTQQLDGCGGNIYLRDTTCFFRQQ